MKIVPFLAVLIFSFFACKNRSTEAVKAPAVLVDSSRKASPEDSSFFSVTDYLRGQLYELKHGGINPLKYVTSVGKTDSTWLKMEDLEKEFSEFLHPEIGPTNLSGLFAEKRFLDQTLDAVTLTYDPVGQLPDSLSLRHWDVYIDPTGGQVRRLYFLKELPNGKTLQLTWNSGKNCRMVTIAPGANGQPAIEKQVLIKWDF